jgi:hypothetical protein
MGLLDAFRRIFGGFIGDSFPDRDPPPFIEKDARQHALDAFADFVAALELANPGSAKSPTFSIPRAQIFTSQPGNPEELKMPSVVVIPGRGRHDAYSLGPASEDEDSVDLFAPGTVLLKLGEYIEVFTLEVWGSHDALRTSILAGIENAMRVGEWSNALLLPTAHFGRVARFALEDSLHVDDPDLVRGRVRGQIFIRLEVPECLLVNMVTMKPYLRLNAATTAADAPDDE